jgi:hypothetical protein
MEENILKNQKVKGWAKGGYHHSKATKKRISKKLKGIKKPPFTKEHRKNIGKTSKGRKFSEESKKKRSIKLKKLWAEGKFLGTKGRKMSEKEKEKISGVNSPLWRGGKLPYTTDWTSTLRRSIRERDNYVCQLCGKLQGDWAFDVHHIDYNKENCNPNNLTTLCRSCHLKTNSNRDFWKEYFYGRT